MSKIANRKELIKILSQIESEILRIRRNSIYTFVLYGAANISGFASYTEKFFLFASRYFSDLNFDYESPQNSDETWFWLWHPDSETFANDIIENLQFYTDKSVEELEHLNDLASDRNRRIDKIEEELAKIKKYLF